MIKRSRVSRVLNVLALSFTFASHPASAIVCNHVPIRLGDSLLAVKRACLQPQERIHTFKRTRVVTDNARGAVRAWRIDRYADQLIYWDSAKRIRVSLIFRDDRLAEVIREYL